LRSAARLSLRGGECERASRGRQNGVGPVSDGRTGSAALVENKGHEGLLFHGPHWVVPGQSLDALHHDEERVRQKSSAACHVG